MRRVWREQPDRRPAQDSSAGLASSAVMKPSPSASSDSNRSTDPTNSRRLTSPSRFRSANANQSGAAPVGVMPRDGGVENDSSFSASPRTNATIISYGVSSGDNWRSPSASY